ncbi:hypothetical protein BTA51_09305 [Hahella sp. CCB-MM4]|uniref:phage tail sheath family protein n=1 Tax=Hahella sp. (strain CCB-MM4) TaxID=1926491 RepID=UPI000B9BA9CE|nr:phage tail sheath C-terminal domain-containing protein [Hahella sp. CCB-MM4]OZG73966.1 hypothetical protein BTA51_09305 [Hahella sp. CCB-MM4]
MPTTYKAPGVYIEEVQTPPSIVGVSTSTAGFVGYCQTTNYTNEARLVTSFTEFRSNYGGFLPPTTSLLAYSVYAFFQQGGSQCYIVNINGATQGGGTPPPQQGGNSPGTKATKTFNNQIVVTAKDVGTSGNNITVSYTGTTFTKSLKINTTTYGAGPSVNLSDIMNEVNGKSKLVTIDLASGAQGSDELIEFDQANLEGGQDPTGGGGSGGNTPPPSGNNFTWATLYGGLQKYDVVDDVNLILIPDLTLTDLTGENLKTALTQTFDYCKNRGDCFFIADVPSGYANYNTPSQLQSFVDDMTLLPYEGFGAVYYPYIQISNPDLYYPPLPAGSTPPANPPDQYIYLPPSGAVAGAYAATDNSVGVFKPAAGVVDGVLNLALNEQVKVTQTDLGNLNMNGINDIRTFKGVGVCIWGARTTAGDASEWKYLNVRRLFIFVEQSIKQSSNWIVFEPNTPKLWGTIIRNITVFLTSLWREGAFAGSSAEEAFFVKVDAENNPPEQRRNGELVIEIGIAPVFPAEFVIIRIGQKTLPA